MSDVTIKSSWQCRLETDELRLVLMALGGRLKPEDIEPAKALGIRLTQQRWAATETQLEHADRALADADAEARRLRTGVKR